MSLCLLLSSATSANIAKSRNVDKVKVPIVIPAILLALAFG